MHPDYLLHAEGYSLWGIDWAIFVSGGYARGLVVFGAALHIRLL